MMAKNEGCNGDIEIVWAEMGWMKNKMVESDSKRKFDGLQ